MPTPESSPVLVADDHDNEAVFVTIQEGVVGIRDWFNDVLEASCEGLSEEGIEETFPGLLARLHDAVTSVPVPALELDHLARYANSVAEKVLGVCLNAQPERRRARGVGSPHPILCARCDPD